MEAGHRPLSCELVGRVGAQASCHCLGQEVPLQRVATWGCWSHCHPFSTLCGSPAPHSLCEPHHPTPHGS